MSHAADLVARHRGQPVYMRSIEAVELARRVLAVDPQAVESPRRFSALQRLKWSAAQVLLGGPDPLQPSAYFPAWAEEGSVEYAGFGLTVIDGIALLNIDTAIVDKGFSWCGQFYHGYDTIDAALKLAFDRRDVKAVFIRMASPGGVVAGGLDEVTETLRANREADDGKPVWAFADMMCSAAYWIGCWADYLVAPRAGIVGSIGAVIVHVEVSEALKGAGVHVTAFESGKQKLSGADFRPLSDADTAHFTSLVAEAADQFVANVTEARPELTADAIRAMEAGWFAAEHKDPARSGVALGLVDDITTEQAAFAALREAIGAAPAATSLGLATQARSPAATKEQTTMAKPGKNGRRAKPAATKLVKVEMTEETLKALRASGIIASTEEDEVEGDPEEMEGEGGQYDDPDAEGDPDDPDAEGGEEDPEAETDPDDPDAMDDDRVEERKAAMSALPGAKMLTGAFIKRLAANPAISLKGAATIIAEKSGAARLGAIADHPVKAGRNAGGTVRPNGLRAGQAFLKRHGRLKKTG